MEDPRTHKLARIVFDVWAGAFEALVDKLTGQFPNEKDRKEFGESMVMDLGNPAYQLYTWVYVSLLLIHIIDHEGTL